MKLDCPNGVQLTVDPAAGVTVRVLPGGTVEVEGRKKAGTGKLAVGMALSMAFAVAIGFVTSDLIRNASNGEANAAADRLARYENSAVPRIQGAEPPAWLLRGDAPREVLPPQDRAAVPTNEPLVLTPSDVERLYQRTVPAPAEPAGRVQLTPPAAVPAPAQPPSNAPQSPFGLDAP